VKNLAFNSEVLAAILPWGCAEKPFITTDTSPHFNSFVHLDTSGLLQAIFPFESSISNRAKVQSSANLKLKLVIFPWFGAFLNLNFPG